MKSNMIAKGLLSAAVAGLVAGAIAPSTALAGGKGKEKKAHTCAKGDMSEECKKHKESGCTGPNGCTGAHKKADAPAAEAAPAAPAPTGK